MVTKKKKKAARKITKRRNKRRKPAFKGAIKRKLPAARKVSRKKSSLKGKTSSKKKALRKRLPAKKKLLGRNIIGTITHYFPKVRAAVVKLNMPLKVGDTIKVKGHTTDFIQSITSMQIDRVPISAAEKGQEIGLMVNSRVRRNDVVCQP